MNSGESARQLFGLVEQHYALVYRYAYRLTGSSFDAEDLAQQTFLVAQSKIDQLREAERAKAWLCTIARNTYLKSLRGRPPEPLAILNDVPDRIETGAGEYDVDSESLQAVLEEMPEEYRSPLILFYFEEFSYKEIADQMEVPLGTIMSRLSRAKAWMRQELTARARGVSASPSR